MQVGLLEGEQKPGEGRLEAVASRHCDRPNEIGDWMVQKLVQTKPLLALMMTDSRLLGEDVA